MTTAHILHENPEWLGGLRTALDGLGVPYREWMLDGGTVPLDQPPPEGVFYNRMSASAHTRGHLHSPELALALIHWLERHGRRVLNGSPALHLEVSKVAQYRALQEAGVKVPATVAAVGTANLKDAALQLGMQPFLIKPNRGGKGAGVRLFNSPDELDGFRPAPEDAPVDGVWLVQQYIRGADPFITRCEFVGGQFLYAVQVDSSQGFELCPADSCRLEDMPADGQAEENKFKIDTAFSQPELLKRYAAVMQAHSIHIAAFEFARDADGTMYTYDLNTNTNYNQRAEQEAGVQQGGMQRIAALLQQELARA